MGLPAHAFGSELILRGQLQDLDLSTLLSALRLGRQHLSLELFDAAGESKGVVALKSGRILSALAGEQRGAAAVRQLLDSRDASEFRVHLQPSDAEVDTEPVGTISEITAAAPAPAPHANGVRKTLPPPLPRATRPTSPSPRRARILEGNLDEFELSHVLEVLSTSRQHFELHVRDEAASSIGVIEVKSGIVIGASTDKRSGVAAARELLNAREGRFVAIRRADTTADRAPLISVKALLQPEAASSVPEDAFEDTSVPSITEALIDAANTGAPTDAVPIPVLDGKLGDLDVASILQVAGASRQYTCVHIFDDQRKPLGVIHLKSGHVVRAQAQDVSGVAAIRRLLHSPRDFSYLVQRYPNASDVTSSIGSIPSVLERAATRSTQPPAASPSRTPTPTHLTPVTSTQPRRSHGAPNSSWMGGAVLGAGFVLLGGIATAIVLRSPALSTSVSAISAAPEPAPLRAPAPAPEPAKHEPAEPEAVSARPPPEAAPQSPAAPASRASIASFQAGLQQLGYDTGPIDGVIGPRTTAAIKAFQYAEHLTVDGALSASTRAVLLRRIGEP